MKDPDLVPLSEDDHSTARIRRSQVREHWRTTGAECFFVLLCTFPVPTSLLDRFFGPHCHSGPVNRRETGIFPEMWCIEFVSFVRMPHIGLTGSLFGMGRF
jgi:hypothetical protein